MIPSLTLFLIAVLFASAIWQLDSISRVLPAPIGSQRRRRAVTGAVAAAVSTDGIEAPWLAPRLEIVCHIAMCFTMGYMLVLMV